MQRPYARITEIDGKYAIEFIDNLNNHVDWFTKSDGSVKLFWREEQAEKVVENYKWFVR